MGASEIAEKLAAKLSKSEADKILEKYGTVEAATALKGPERQQYLDALDSVYGSRDVRAKNLGFSDETYYHGTTADKPIDKFKSNKAASGQVYGRGTYVTSDPETAAIYTEKLDQHSGVPLEDQSGSIYPLKIRANKTFGADQLALPGTKERLEKLVGPSELPKNWEKINKENRLKDAVVGKVTATDYSKAIADSGYDSIEGFHPSEKNVINSKNIRSTNAAFDPRFKDSANILALAGSQAPKIAARLIKHQMNLGTAFSDIVEPIQKVDAPVNKLIEQGADKFSKLTDLKRGTGAGADETYEPIAKSAFNQFVGAVTPTPSSILMGQAMPILKAVKGSKIAENMAAKVESKAASEAEQLASKAQQEKLMEFAPNDGDWTNLKHNPSSAELLRDAVDKGYGKTAVQSDPVTPLGSVKVVP